MKILTVSSANMDFIMQTEKMPKSGETFISRGGYTYVPGGKGANSALAFARLGADSVFCSAVGEDANGDALVSLYEREGIDVSFMRRCPDVPTGLAAIVLEKDSGANRLIVFPAANMHLTKKQVTDALDCRPDAVFMQFEIDPEITLFTALEAARRNIPIFMDAGPADPDFPYSRLEKVTLFSPNETECEILTGISPDSFGLCMKAAERLTEMTGAYAVVIKLGGRGCFIYENGKGEEIPSYPIEKVDTTAAGDAFTAALTLEYLKSGDLRRSARYANAVGALTVSKLGASASLPTSEEVSSFILERGIDINE